MENDKIEKINLNKNITFDGNLKKKNYKFKIILWIAIIIFFIILLSYIFILIKYSFKIEQKEIIIQNGSNYQVELLPNFMCDFDNNNYIYEIENSNLASIDKFGLITTKNNGITELKIRYKYSFITKKIKIKIEDIAVNSIDFKDIDIKTNESIRIKPIINNKDNIYTSLTYESKNTNIAKVDGYGNITGISKGETIIEIKSDKIIKEIKVKVNSEVKEIEKISLTDKNIYLKKGSKMKLIPVIEPIDATDSNLLWTSNSGNVVVDSTGVVIGNQFGVSTITVETSNGKKASCVIMVIDNIIKVTDISLNKTNIEMKVGEMFQLNPTIVPNNTTLRNLTWQSSNEKVVQVNNGKILAKKKGKAIVTVKSSNNKIATCNVLIKEKEVKAKKINLSINNTILNVGNSVELKPTIMPLDTVNKNIIWTSSNDKIATVENGRVIARKEGVVVITAKTTNGKKTSTIIIVKNSNV